jgi:NADH-quinone oxidoreductase subunit N
VLVIGSMISLGYYLPVIAAMWMRGAPGAAAAGGTGAITGPLPALAGGSPELDAAPELPGVARTVDPPSEAASGVQPEVALVAVLAGAATIFFGVIPQPLFDLVHAAGGALGGLF